MKKIFLIDASSFIYRSYFAIPPMTNADGQSTNALFGFIRSVNKLIKDFSPTHMAAVFDGRNNAKKRLEIYPDYKKNRASLPPDLPQQIQWAKEYCDFIGIPKLDIEEVEADDAMGSVAEWAAKEGSEVYLCTSDKDMAQLVNDKVFLLNTHKDNQILDSKGVEEVYGVPPDKIIDLLAIMGDSSDNVPGLSGFGPKTAVALLKDLGSLNNILSHPEKVPGKKKQETIREQSDIALLSKKLVTIDTAVPFPHQAKYFTIAEPQLKEIKDFYAHMGFNSLLKELDKEHHNGLKEEGVKYNLVDDEKSLETLIQLLSKQKEICFDTETTSIHPMEAELVGLGFCFQAPEAWYIPTNGKLGLQKVLDAVKPLLEDSKVGIYGHNIKYDYQVMRNYDIAIANISYDTILASYLLHSENRRHSLDQLALDHFGKVKIATSDLIGKGKNTITMQEVPIEKVAEYCCEDVDYTCRLKQKLQVELKERGLEKLLFEIELPLVKVLADMERTGIFLDTPVLEKLSKKVAIEIAHLEKEIQDMAGESFNVKSPKQLSEILYTKLLIPAPKKTATGYSTSADVLEALAEKYPIAQKILEFRTVEKLRSTYIDVLPQMVNPKTHRIHCSFNQTVAATGRLSCQDPNLQNIPIRTALGREIRSAFRPEKEGWSFLSADYSQIELRLLAHFSEDPTLIEAFNHHEDIHAHTASQIFDVPLDKVTKEQRHRAKAVNFGVIYGQQAFGLGQGLGISMKDASEFIETYFKHYGKVRDFIEECKEKSRKTGKTVTLFGRERALPEIHNKNRNIRSAAERLAINTPLQGTGADLIKSTMLKLDQALKSKNFNAKMILQIHDELIFELPDSEIEPLSELVADIMQNVVSLKVPLVVDISVGKNWKEC